MILDRNNKKTSPKKLAKTIIFEMIIGRLTSGVIHENMERDYSGITDREKTLVSEQIDKVCNQLLSKLIK